jgi:DNA-binding NarL/FixJ family response regulator
MSITILLSDDHAVVRDGLKLLLETQPDLQVVGEAADGQEALRLAERLKPNVAILDIAMPELDGIETARRIHQSSPDTQLIILSMYNTNEHVSRALQTGVRGYVLKESAGSEVVKAIRTVLSGRRYLSQKISDRVIDIYLQPSEAVPSENILARLSAREREVFQLVVEGKSNPEIANILFLSTKTVETYRSRLIQKLEIRDISSLVKLAIKLGLTTIE